MKHGDSPMRQLTVIAVAVLASVSLPGLVGCATYVPTNGQQQTTQAPQQIDESPPGAPGFASSGKSQWQGPVLNPRSEFKTAPTPLSLGFEIGIGNTIESAGPQPDDAAGWITGKVLEANPRSRIILIEPDDGSTFIVLPCIGARLIPPTSSAVRNLLRFRIAEKPDVEWNVLKSGSRVRFQCREFPDHSVGVAVLTAL